MNPADYDAWYDTPRGRWIGDTEYALAMRLLAPQAGDSLLDVGCGTGWFTRRAAADGLRVTGLDPNPAWLDYARAGSPESSWVEGDARDLPFADASYDHVLSITALCFIDDERQAVAEIVRVARRRFAIGWLNRNSLLYAQKGRDGGSGAYRGAHWRTADEVRALFSGLPVRNLTLRSAIFLPSATPWARELERLTPSVLPWGGLLLAAGEKF
ncbi:class I SAM-dependent methyltransferase [Thiobacillus sp.]|uniref:class I SAM-dependent methyltransferase n=1 Tax=Thiobacillus sp. TaxID=924 RepID=UPI0011DC5595|nr:class I SAM-dependent methyltransferase [Thiobacillus sp.]TXH73956.1 MAG: class I SAM-dependent methyltransferase [Thiobacillus sp.]